MSAAGPNQVERVDRFRGCLLGLAIGDALGHPTEFVASVPDIVARWGGRVETFQAAGVHRPGTFTDDTQMTIGVARALIRRGHGSTDELMTVLGQELVAWLRSPQNDRAPGGTCLRGCSALEGGTPWQSAGVAASKGCGAAMRAAPIGLYFADDIEAMIVAAAAQSVLTHRHPTGIASSVAAAAPVAHVVRTGSLDGIVAFTRACVNALSEDLLVDIGCPDDLARSIGVSEMLRKLDELDACVGAETDDVCSLLGEAWVGEEAVATGLWCALKAGRDYRASIVRGANSAGDSDSIATIAGSISGALVGIDAIDEHYRAGVEKSEIIDGLARALFDASIGEDLPRTGPALDVFGAERG
ncbi:MAG: ADP-ribosylglycohydrolase family protein [Polyangiaceae bacterium]|nr:ADP-ribosylglycohydrolase family protein [Polyangiaceae bacterium]